MKEKKSVPSNQSLLSSFDGSRKVYEKGSRPDILVPKREIALSHTVTEAGGIKMNQSVYTIRVDRTLMRTFILTSQRD